MSSGKGPTWETDIAALFAEPYWVTTDPVGTGKRWAGCMGPYFIDLTSYADVRTNSVLVYRALHSRWMPLGATPAQQWPDEALALFRRWVNEGWPRSPADPLDPAERIPPPGERPLPLRIRRDLRSLTTAELDDYRARVDTALELDNPAPDSPGQQFFSIHGDWCLHYQEAFLLWHRAYLMQFEQRIGCAVPYWNWYAEGASVDGAPGAGLPQAFRDLTYVHPATGEVRPNPLRFAVARDGKSKACVPAAPSGVDCRYVQRDPVLYTTGDDQRAARTKKLALTLLYQQQVHRAMGFTAFSHPQGIGYPWANIPTFDPPPPDSDYVYRDVNFDGAYEQPHDNYHGWVGPDMADNAYTAFDPVFFSYHANIDRIFECWLRANPTVLFTANTPLRPFSGPLAQAIAFTDPRAFVYTTIGDLARDCRGLGYDYGAPVDPDYRGATARAQDELLVTFDDVRCTLESYAIDAFLDLPAPTLADVDAANPHYVGRFSRIGMGIADDKGRCITEGVRRVLDATPNARRLGLAPGAAAALSLLVTRLADGTRVPPDEVAALPGFVGTLAWVRQGRALAAPSAAPVPAASGCCHTSSGSTPGTSRSGAPQFASEASMFTFSLPGFIQDFPKNSPHARALDALWNLYAESWIQQAMPGAPAYFYDPQSTPIPQGTGSAIVTWFAFPGRLMQYFSQKPPNSPPNPYNLTDAQVFSLADTGYYTDGSKQVSFPQIPTTLCPQANWSGTLKPFGPYGPRGWLDEYCEWSVARNASGNITRIDFACENPEYWYSLWSVDQERVRELYESTLNAGAPASSHISVALADLQLKDAKGNLIIDPSTGKAAYNPLNRWNSGPTSVRTGPASGFTGGVMHLTSTPNTLQTELGLAGAATPQYQCGNSDAQTLICCGEYGQEYRNSDPHIGFSVNRIVGGQASPPNFNPALVCLANPVGLYIQTPDLTALQFGPSVVIGKTVPAGAKPSDILTIIRGQQAPIDPVTGAPFPGDMLLHVAFQIPASWLAMTPTMTLADLTVSNTQLTWAGQLASQTQIGLFARPLPSTTTPPQVPCAGPPSAGAPVQCMFEALWNGYYAINEPSPGGQPMSLASNTVIVPPRLPATGVAQTLVVTCNSPTPTNPVVQIMLADGSGPDPSITTKVTGSSQVTYAVPGNSYPSTYTSLCVQVSVAVGAAGGLRNLAVVGGGTLPCAVAIAVGA